MDVRAVGVKIDPLFGLVKLEGRTPGVSAAFGHLVLAAFRP